MKLAYLTLCVLAGGFVTWALLRSRCGPVAVDRDAGWPEGV